MELPSPPRTSDEVEFFARETPCPSCGGYGLVDTGPAYPRGVYSGRCARCNAARELRFLPMPNPPSSPLFHLGPEGEATKLFTADQLRAIADRHLAAADPDPTEHATLATFRIARNHVERGRTALNELAKLRPGDAAVTAEIGRVAALYEAYMAATKVIEAKPGAHPKPTSLDGRFNAHRHWIKRGRVGDGQLVFRDERLSDVSATTKSFDGAIVEDSTFERVALSFGTFHGTQLTRARFLACDLGTVELHGATLDHCDLARSRMSMAELIDVTATGGDWQRIVAGRSTWSGRFVEVDLHEASLRDSRLDGPVFERCDLREVDFSRRDPYLDALGAAREARFVDCDLRGLKIHGWRLDRVVFERCKLHGLEGTPVLEGDVQIIDPDLSPGGDGGADALGAARLLAAWKGPS